MKRNLTLISLLLAAVMLLSSCDTLFWNAADPSSCTHKDKDDNGVCDSCDTSVLVTVDLYAINDLHGKFDDTESNAGVDELTTYLKYRASVDDHTVFLSSGDMWQGSSESNLTKGSIITEWMNHLDFASMTLGNHEYDWGEEYIEMNAELADFPFLAINVFDRETDTRVEYCDASAVVERGGIEIGIIGAIGDCYSSISGDKSDGFYIKTGRELTELVKAESERLRADGVDLIVYSIHDGYDDNTSGEKYVSSSSLSGYYDSSLSSQGYVDLVFEGHTHKRYVLVDGSGVYHLQNGGDNKGISHAEVRINSVTGSSRVSEAEFVRSSVYERLSDDLIVDELLEKYKDQIAAADVVVGRLDRDVLSEEIKSLVAKLYYEYGIEKWGEMYDIVLGGGFVSARSPYDLKAGEIRYSHVQMILPFDNELVLCSVKGSDLQSRFFETVNENYYIFFDTYGEGIKNNIDPDKTYYIVTDTYSSSYAANRLTEVEMAGESIYARDLLAEYIKSGRLK